MIQDLEPSRPLIFAFTILAACMGGNAVSTSPTIPEGRYEDPTGDESVSVQDDQITFDIVLIGKKAGQRFQRTYSYRLRPNGLLQPYPVRSVDAVFGIGNFEWVWDGSTLAQNNKSTHELIQAFTPSK